MPLFEGVEVQAPVVQYVLAKAGEKQPFTPAVLMAALRQSGCAEHLAERAAKGILQVEDAMGRAEFSGYGWRLTPDRRRDRPGVTSRAEYLARLCQDLEQATGPSRDLDLRVAAATGLFDTAAPPEFTSNEQLSAEVIARDFPQDEGHYERFIGAPRLVSLSGRHSWTMDTVLLFLPSRGQKGRYGNVISVRRACGWWGQNEAIARSQALLQFYYAQEVKDLEARWPNSRTPFGVDIFEQKEQLGDLGTKFPMAASRYRDDEFPLGLPWLVPETWQYQPASDPEVSVPLPPADSWAAAAAWSPSPPEEIGFSAEDLRDAGIRMVDHPGIDDGKIYVWSVSSGDADEIQAAFREQAPDPSAVRDLLDDQWVTAIACRPEGSRRAHGFLAFRREVSVNDGHISYDLSIESFEGGSDLVEDGLLRAAGLQILCDIEVICSMVAANGHEVQTIGATVQVPGELEYFGERVEAVTAMARKNVFGEGLWYKPKDFRPDELRFWTSLDLMASKDLSP